MNDPPASAGGITAFWSNVGWLGLNQPPIKKEAMEDNEIPPAEAGGLFNPSLPSINRIFRIPPAEAGGLFNPSLISSSIKFC
ncbi:MAG: hypothetical protein IPG76_17760 [Acidobacteria bacterium]|nr:hypothetical protein [Acidobacteriota bacterium]